MLMLFTRWPGSGQNQSFCSKYCDYKWYKNGKWHLKTWKKPKKKNQI
jgi:hypothetical protein